MEKRLVSSEFNAMKRFAAALSELHYTQEELKSHWQMVENGEERIDKCVKDFLELFDDILDTIPAKQVKTLRNATGDYKIALVPQLKPESNSVVYDKEFARNLIDLAQEKCKTCVETPEDAEKCPIFQLSTAIVPVDTYDTLICPYSQAEWLD